ncbi:MAG: leucine-rich repeat protein [Firmicutes bacterium]|nr:leucine-rich repeat protein [Bacillota bacterium]
MKKISILLPVLIFFILCNCVSGEDDSLKAPLEKEGRHFSDIPLCDSLENVKLFSADESLLPLSAYVDENNKLKALYFEAYEDVEDLSFYMEDILLSVEKEYVSPYLYVYINDDITVADSISLDVEIGGSKEEVAFNCVEITGSDKDWITNSDGHTLMYYTGSEKNVVAPNFYNGKIISSVADFGSTLLPDYNNLLDKNTDITEINSLTLSEGIDTVGHSICYDIEALTQLTLPDSIRQIGAYSFTFTGLTDLKIPEKCEQIYVYAFYATKIGSITFGTSLKNISSFAFCECSKLSGELIIPEGVENLGNLAFAGFSKSTAPKFTEIVLPSSLKKIGGYCFQNLYTVKNITLSEGLETIGDGAFDHMSGLRCETFKIPSTVKQIGGVFDGIGLKAITPPLENYGGHIFHDLGTYLKAYEVAEGSQYFTAVDGVLYNKALTRLVAYPPAKEAESYEILEGVTVIDELAFGTAAKLKTLTLPDSFVISENIPVAALNRDANTLSVGIYLRTGIENILVKDTNENYKSVTGILYSKDGTTLYYIPQKKAEDIEVEESVKNIAKGSIYFEALSDIKWKSLKFPKNIEYISDEITTLLKNMRDVNNDKKTDSKDVSLILKYSTGKITDINRFTADVNRDGEVNILDAVAMLEG